MSSTNYLLVIQQYFTRYGMTTYTAIGNFGLLFNIIFFIGPAYHRNLSSLCGLIGLNFATIPGIYAVDHSNPLTSNLLFCQLQFYFRHSFNQMMRTYFILACADRYAISSSRVRIRSFSQFKIAIWISFCGLLIWLSLSIFPVILRTLQNGKCEGKTGLPSIILSIYIAIIVGVIPLVFMIIFSLLMLKNLKNIRTCVHPIRTIHNLGKRDRDLLRMLYNNNNTISI